VVRSGWEFGLLILQKLTPASPIKIIILDQISLLLQGYMPIEQDYSMYSTVVFNSIVELSHHIFCYMEPMVSRVGI